MVTNFKDDCRMKSCAIGTDCYQRGDILSVSTSDFVLCLGAAPADYTLSTLVGGGTPCLIHSIKALRAP